MFLTYLMLAVALCLSVIAEFYSIAGLAAIFAGSPVSIIVMGVILGAAKLSIIVWLHEFWQQVKLLMKIYLVSAVLVLMFLTSMGIFGYLSKAHIEQVGAGQENAAQIQRITAELKRQTEIVSRAEERARTLETTGTGADANVNSQIRTEQGRIDSALARVQPAIEEQQRIIDGQTKLYSDQVAKIDEQLAQLQKFIDAKEVDKAQALVGVKVDGDWGPGTARAVTTWRTARATERTTAVAKLEEANRDPTIRAARDEILRIRKTVETQVAESNKLIDRLRNQLGKGDTASVETLVNEQQEKIKVANAEIETLTQKKYMLEAEYRKLEVEVGPIKYIAELVYGDSTDQSMLERAVRWVTMLIVAVFDPLAAMMLLAATESMTWIRRVLPAPAVVPAAPEPVKEKTPKYQPGIKKHRVRVWRRKHKQPDVAAPVVEEDEEDDPTESIAVKEAKKNWKANNPDSTLKEQKRLLAQGLISRLPWEENIPVVETQPVADKVSFGQIWPDNPIKGFMFLRTDYIPSKLFKFNGIKWIEVDKSLTDSYAYNSAYIEYLMDKIAAGEYDPELLSPAEQEQIELKLTPKGQ
jgi:hypothetical protein